ncbi:conserved hypothetical protein [Nitrospina gracilis 3/211]|uniref:Uncharacterized protein n=1 Tax=Nitrospina gracilis (strain 3/211) TaxID=1266370 RepID=M1YV98_NITG3|nr:MULTISPECIES: hypothetical protein [Nitrospina]MCF8722602.1 type VI protein secretion system component VasK [Nitrospina sp. Nb-3]CCQ89532.1 conserved hypothetical protein [Nitrospina gracilis 3/211]
MPENSSSSKPASPSVNDTRLPRWVWVVFALLIAAMVPVWPIEGYWLGFPAWAVLALGVSVAASGFIAWVTLSAWREPEDEDPAA